MDEIRQGLRYLFQTSSNYTLLASGTGHAGMEMAIANLVEPGDTVVVGNKGIWVRRASAAAGRLAEHGWMGLDGAGWGWLPGCGWLVLG